MASVQQYTIQYRTFLKRALRQSLEQALETLSTDETVARTDVVLGWSKRDYNLPVVLVGFSEEQMPNAGVGHYEWLAEVDDTGTPTGNYIEYQHRTYKGSVTFDIYAQSTIDLDVLADAVVGTIAMDEVSAQGQAFINRFYNEIQANSPAGIFHLPTLNTDQIIPGGDDNPVPPPWNPEDALVYHCKYSVAVFGEFYSYVPPNPTSTGPIVEVDVYEYPSEDGGQTSLDPLLPPPPVPSEDYQKYTGFREGSRTVPTGPGGD